MNSPRSILASRISAAALVCLAASSLHAADRFWISPLGGGFGTPGLADSDWSLTNGGAGGATAPTTTDIANFTLNNTYTVTFSTAVTNSALDVESGTVTFDLNGHTYTLTDSLGVDIAPGSGQTARLTITDGVLGVNTNGDDVTIGISDFSSGFLTVSAGGRLGDGVIRPDVIVGYDGTGTLTVNDNGRIDAQVMTIGTIVESGNGSATVTGPNAVVDISSSVTIGSFGTGTLNIFNGGTVTGGTAFATVGAGLGSHGTVTVSGLGSSWTLGTSLGIGNNGDGTLTISSGGRVSGTTATVGQAAGSGVATVTGVNSLWELTGTLTIGSLGVGTVTVSNGGKITSSASATLGNSSGSVGRMTITGSGSSWSLTSATIGSSGSGELTVSSGAEFSSTTLTLGGAASGSGTMTVTGVGSKSNTVGSITVGSVGNGTLNVTAGGEMYLTTTLTIGDPAGAPIGVLNLDGGSIYIGDDFIANGTFNFKDGLLQVVGDFQPSAAAAPLTINGPDNSSLPTLDLVGAGTTTNVTSLNVGSTRRGQLLLRESRVMNLGSNLVNIGAVAGGEGFISVESGAQLITTGTLSVGGSGATAGGAGTLNIIGGTVDVGTLQLHSGGVINLDGGTFAPNALTTLNGQFHWTSGTLRLDNPTNFLTSTVAAKLIGPDYTLRAGRTLATSASGQVTLQTPLTVDGGVINVNTLVNQSTLEIRSGSVNGAGTATNTGLILLSHPLAAFGGITGNNDGTIRGTGRITGNIFNNNAAGRLEVLAGERLVLEAVMENFGTISVIGGELQANDSFDNNASTGLVSARDAILRFADVINNGSFAFSNGTVDVYGSIIQGPGARITVSNGGIANFYDDVTIGAGAPSVHATALGGFVSRVVFFGSYNGGLTGGGQAFMEGDHRPGASPALVTFEGDAVYGSFATVEMELGGTARGTQYDAINVAGKLTFGGTMNVPLIGGFQPQGGDVFNLFDFGTTSGAFSTVNLPALNPGLAWSQANLYTAGEIRVVLDTAFTGRVWDGGGANNAWSTDFNWDLNVEPLNNSTADLIFAGTTRLTPSVDTAWNIHSITFNNTAGAFTITGPQGITVGAGGIINNDGDLQTITAQVTLSASESFTAALGDLAFSSVNIGAHTLTIAGANDVELDDVTGTGTITKTGAGDLNLIGAVGTGGITLNANAGTTNIGADETFAALNIGAGATVTLGTLAPAPAFEAIPEPGFTLLLSAGLLTLLFPRRR